MHYIHVTQQNNTVEWSLWNVIIKVIHNIYYNRKTNCRICGRDDLDINKSNNILNPSGLTDVMINSHISVILKFLFFSMHLSEPKSYRVSIFITSLALLQHWKHIQFLSSQYAVWKKCWMSLTFVSLYIFL